MQKRTLEIYETVVTVFEYTREEIFTIGLKHKVDGNKVTIEDTIVELVEGASNELIMHDGVLTLPEGREAKRLYGEALVINEDDRTVEKFFVVLAEKLDAKQMTNVYLSLGANQGYLVEDVLSITTIKKPVEHHKKKKRK